MFDASCKMTIDPGGVHLDHKKNKAIQRLLAPKNVRSFFNNKSICPQNKDDLPDLRTNLSQEGKDGDLGPNNGPIKRKIIKQGSNKFANTYQQGPRNVKPNHQGFLWPPNKVDRSPRPMFQKLPTPPFHDR